MIARLRGAVFALVFWTATVAVVLGAPLAALFGTRTLRRYVHRWLALHGWCTRIILGITRRVEGVVPTGPTLYASKHEAMYETFELVRILDEPAIVMKRELARIPVWGWAARRYGMIAVDRAASAGALRAMMREARAVQAEGRSVLIFPEGTRVPPGEAPPLKSGLAGLYKALGLPLVPIALDSGSVWPRHGTKRPGVVTFRLGETIPPGLPRGEIEVAVHRAINQQAGETT